MVVYSRGANGHKQDRRRSVVHAPSSILDQTASRAAEEAAVAGYIADMTAQLESMASAAGLDLLAYFLAMARAEAAEQLRAPCEALRAL
ncbi:MAG: hypothetical protein ACLPSW_32815 [Roseiarcus sp.]